MLLMPKFEWVGKGGGSCAQMLSMISSVFICYTCVCVFVCVNVLVQPQLPALIAGHPVVYEYSCYTRSFICSHYNYQRPRGAKGPKDIDNNNNNSSSRRRRNNNTYAICLNSTWPECWIALDMRHGETGHDSGQRRLQNGITELLLVCPVTQTN